MMLFKPNDSRNDKWCQLLTWVSTASLLLVFSGCSLPQRKLLIWKQAAEFEHVARFRFDQESTENQWFTRLVDQSKLPDGCVHPLSDKFSFVMVKSDKQWRQLTQATNLQPNLKPPSFRNGIVVGLLTKAGETRADRWPSLISVVRQRGSVVFLVAEFFQGYYRPLEVPPYLHLIYVPGAKHVLGVKINHQLFGFNVEIADLNEAGIH